MSADQVHAFVRRLDPDEAPDVLGLAGETLYEFTGVTGEESALDGPFAKVVLGV